MQLDQEKLKICLLPKVLVYYFTPVIVGHNPHFIQLFLFYLFNILRTCKLHVDVKNYINLIFHTWMATFVNITHNYDLLVYRNL